MITRGKGWLLETVDDGLLLKRENAIAKEDWRVCQEKGWRCDGIGLLNPAIPLSEIEEEYRLKWRAGCRDGRP